ncbi:FkbM family methyltransferase [Xanthomonas sp. WHRI 7945]|nr:FkbM family methyltransferase [Xanthomonas campestris pv. campestris]
MAQNSTEAVKWAYRLLLDREPENEQAIEAKLNLATIRDLRLTILGSEEYTGKRENPQKTAQSPFFHYTSAFDAVAVMRSHAAKNPEPKPGYLVNFLGVAIDPKFFPTILSARAGEVEPLPIPANWHADIAEWGAALRAVDLAGESFTMAELGCGWGCWMNNTGVAARKSGRKVKVIGIEGDGDHVQFAREALGTNGFADDEIDLRRGVAAATSGIALFPRQDVPGTTWGSEPIFGASEEQRSQAVEAGSHDEIQMLSLAELLERYPRIDLLHVDIQGGEADLVEQTLSLLSEKVAYILIGTHTKQIEGRLFEAFTAAAWQLEMERAAIFDIADGAPRIRVDGVQAWRNPRLFVQQQERSAS